MELNHRVANRFLPYLFAMLADGMYQWKLKRYVFGKVTVQFYRIWFRAFWVISALTMVYGHAEYVTI